MVSTKSGEDQTAHAELNIDWEHVLYGGLRGIKTFGSVGVSTRGSVEKIGLTESGLKGFLSLRLKNNFAGIKYENLLEPYRLPSDTEKSATIGTFWCNVWTVGDDYPIAYHVKCRGGNLNNYDIWSSEDLGYGNKRTVPESIKEALNKLVEEFAIQFLNVHGEM